MSEKKYFKFKSISITSVYAFPSKIKVVDGYTKEIKTADVDFIQIQKMCEYKEITEAEFLEVFHEVQNEITLRYHNQFSKENDFIKNESLKSEGY